MDSNRPILVVDDEPEILTAVDTSLRMAGYDQVVTLADSRDVIRCMERQIPSLIILDLNMPHIKGGRLLRIIRKPWPRIPVLVLTGSIEVDTAVRCMKIGAVDYMVKPIEADTLLAAVKRALAMASDGEDQGDKLPEALFSQVKNPRVFKRIITQDAQMHSIFHYVEAVAPSSRPVLVFGETGVGKELIGKCIHDLSRQTGPLVVVNVAGLDDNVFSDTLFGHLPGAFTGADKGRPGLIERAQGGTLLLDEVGDLTLSSQVKLLRLIQEGEYLPLGSDRTRHSNARIIASTNQDLWALEAQGKFRKDLIYRLSTHTLTLPPLRDRLVDLPLLLDRFVCQAADELDKPVPDIPKGLIEELEAYPFKGNVRELKSMVHDAVSRHRGGPMSSGLFPMLGQAADTGDPGSQGLPTLKEAARELVEKAMVQAQGNQSAAARILGISQQALSKRLKKLRNASSPS